ncbi:MAG: thioredoxin [Candidatus Coatesbacteria bacterium RBG_13_66_14]|uniref:Thioredoxin n=1 Tax=Candidatus Coatesbacteria bacterium RBG_13_66_14 TaxID=1817816 RepID=A0A1F5EW70_9BACT|nr:MAG: thioredoxin [Candidatus Coatesbacteria bacterium RBG_13_66_14]
MASEFIVTGTDDNFAAEVEKHDGVAMVDFWAVWCGPCLAVAPAVEEIAEEYKGRLKVVKVNVDENPNVAAKFGIRGIPTLLFFKKGEVVRQVVGAQPKKRLVKTVDEVL